MTPELVLALIRNFARDETLEAPSALLDLFELLTRTHAEMDNDDWEVIAIAGGLLWRATMGDVEVTADAYLALIGRLRK